MLPVSTRELNLINQEIGEYLPGKEFAFLVDLSEATVSRNKYNGGGPVASVINLLNALERERLFASQNNPNEAKCIDELMGRICSVISLPASRYVYKRRFVHSITPDAIQAMAQTSRNFAELIEKITASFSPDSAAGEKLSQDEYAGISREADELAACCQLIKEVCAQQVESNSS